MDNRSLNNLNTLHPKWRMTATKAWQEAQDAMPDNVKIIVIQGYRSFADSDALYAQGRTEPGPIVTYAPAGESYHNYGMAFDFAMVTNGKDDYVVGPNWLKVVSIMEKYGIFWGGNFPAKPRDKRDFPHFENKFGYNWRQLLAKYNAGDFIAGTHFVNI